MHGSFWPLRAALMLGAVWLAGCEMASGGSCPPGSTLTYESFGRPFMESYCLRCHNKVLTGVNRRGAPVGVDFDTLQGVRAHSFEIDGVAAAGPAGVSERMPPDTPRPTEQERRRLGEWLACGAP